MHECLESMCEWTCDRIRSVSVVVLSTCCYVSANYRTTICVKEYKISTRLAALLRLLHCRLLHRLLELQPQAVGHTLLAR